MSHRVLSPRMNTTWFGFVGLLGLMAYLAVDSGLLLRAAATTSNAVRNAARQRDAVLDQLRTEIYQSGIVVRDYLLEQDDEHAASQRLELEALRGRINNSALLYEAKLAPPEKADFEQLRDRLRAYWESIAPALEWSTEMRRRSGERLLRTTVIPNRMALIHIVRQLTALNERDLDAAEQSVQNLQSQFQRTVTTVSVIALLLGGSLAFAVVRRVQWLERIAEQRYQEVEAAKQELRHLSDRLIRVQEEERRRLSRELHDEIGQLMAAMLVEIGRVNTSQPEYARERLSNVRRMAENCVAMVRNMALLLRPSMLDDLGLLPALQWQAREVTRRTGLKVKLIADVISDDLPDSHRTCVYRVVQEALTNCTKHSRAKQVDILIHQGANEISMMVQDDGAGFDPEIEKGLGVLGMEERVKALAGRFSIQSQPGKGATVSARFPLDRAFSVVAREVA